MQERQEMHPLADREEECSRWDHLRGSSDAPEHGPDFPRMSSSSHEDSGGSPMT